MVPYLFIRCRSDDRSPLNGNFYIFSHLLLERSPLAVFAVASRMVCWVTKTKQNSLSDLPPLSLLPEHHNIAPNEAEIAKFKQTLALARPQIAARNNWQFMSSSTLTDGLNFGKWWPIRFSKFLTWSVRCLCVGLTGSVPTQNWSGNFRDVWQV